MQNNAHTSMCDIREFARFGLGSPGSLIPSLMKLPEEGGGRIRTYTRRKFNVPVPGTKP